MPLISEFKYRPEIDGLRALAVVAVLLFHAGFGFPGGYVGVDVFFVISGYLITSLIWKDLEAGKFSFAHFWERRARRIVPAAVVLTTFTLIVGYLLIKPNGREKLGMSAEYQAMFSANIYFWKHLGYFDGQANSQPLLHTWSLAIEEQFYFTVPWVFWALYRLGAVRKRGTLLAILTVGFLASLGVSIYYVSFTEHANTAFYLLPSRAWELMTGSILAFVPVASGKLNTKPMREIISLVGLGLIFWPVFFYTAATPFPGLAALWPCLGAAVLIWANTARLAEQAPTFVGRLLSLKPIVFIGLISYSLYLWHWPLLVFGRYYGLDSASKYRVILLIAAVVASILSYWLVETPFRKRWIGRSQKAIYAYACIGLLIMAAGGEVCRRWQMFPTPLPAGLRIYIEARRDKAPELDVTADDIRQNRVPIFGENHSSKPPTVVLWGDSHAMAMIPALDAMFKKEHHSFAGILKPGVAPILNWSNSFNNDASQQIPIAFNDEAIDYIRRHHIEHVILSAFWSLYWSNAKIYGQESAYEQALVKTVTQLVHLGVQTWIILDVPHYAFDVPQTLILSSIFGINLNASGAKPSPDTSRDSLSPETLDAIRAVGGRILDPKPYFLSPDGSHYIVVSRGIVLYQDDSHLTASGSLLMLRSFFEKKLKLDGLNNHRVTESDASDSQKIDPPPP